MRFTLLHWMWFCGNSFKYLDDVMDASAFVKTVQKACGMQIYCIEEIAWRRGMISHEEFIRLGEQMKDIPYGKYILEIAEAKVTESRLVIDLIACMMVT